VKEVVLILEKKLGVKAHLAFIFGGLVYLK